jgi:proteasome accessory factor A
MEPRVVGCETELALSAQDSYGSWSQASVLHAASLVLRQYMPEARYPRSKETTSHFYENGQRIYLDCGDHIEIATAESSDSREVVAGHLAGLLLVHSGLKRAYEDGKIHSYSLANRVVSDEDAWGEHENYLIERSVVRGNGSSPLDAHKLRAILPFLAVRSQVSGAGSIRNGKFHLAQKATRITSEVSLSTTTDKPLINTRDEPHANRHKYARFHLVMGDPLSPHIKKRTLDSTSLVLRMVEQGRRPALNHRGVSWALAARTVAGDLTLTRQVGGMTGLDIHEKYLEVLSPMVQAGVPDREREAFDEWTRVYEKLRNVQSYANEHATEPDLVFIVGRYVVANLAGDHQLDWAERLAFAYDPNTNKTPEDRELDFDLVSVDGKMGKFWERIKTPEAEAAIPRSLIKARMHTPPKGRAEDRAQFIREYHDDPDGVVVDWGKIGLRMKRAGLVELALDEPAKRHAGYQDFKERIARARIEDADLLREEEAARNRNRGDEPAQPAPIAM